jgi:hypothetical protein
MIWGAIAPLPLFPHTLLASSEIADSQPNNIICHRRHCCQLLTEIARLPAQISVTGGKRVHRTYTVHTFSWPLLSFAAEFSASGPHTGKAPYHFLPPSSFPHLVYTYHCSAHTPPRGCMTSTRQTNLCTQASLIFVTPFMPSSRVFEICTALFLPGG